MSTLHPICVTPALAIHDLACRAGRSGRGPARGGESTHVVVLRRGAFAAHVGAQHYIADACTALISWERCEYRISHPGDGGDDGTVFELAPALVHEVLGHLVPHRDVEVRVTPRVQVAYAGFLAAARRAGRDPLGCEEAGLELLRAAVGGAGRRVLRGRGRARCLATAAIEVLNDAPELSHSASAIAGAIGCSPYYLMRVFRRETGTTLRAYRVRLRVAAALHRLAAGHDDLARLAAELGFASHAHLTDTLSRVLGFAPRELRRELARADLASVGRFLEARAGGAA